jgi:anaerobic selenocysteine-containing dehydrogenase
VAQARRGLIMTTPFEEARQRRQAEAGFWLPSYKTFDEFWTQMAERGGWWDPAEPLRDLAGAFQTPSGKYEFYSLGLGLGLDRPGRRQTRSRRAGPAAAREAALNGLGVVARGDQIFLPHYEPPRFAGDPKEFPLHLTTYKPMALMGSRTANQPWLAEISAGAPTRAWEAWVDVNPETAHALGIHDREPVWVESPAGKMRLRARLYAGVHPDVVSVPYGSGHEAGGRWAEAWGANPNRLVADGSDRAAGAPALFATRVRIRKANDQ